MEILDTLSAYQLERLAGPHRCQGAVSKDEKLLCALLALLSSADAPQAMLRLPSAMRRQLEHPLPSASLFLAALTLPPPSGERQLKRSERDRNLERSLSSQCLETPSLDDNLETPWIWMSEALTGDHRLPPAALLAAIASEMTETQMDRAAGRQTQKASHRGHFGPFVTLSFCPHATTVNICHAHILTTRHNPLFPPHSSLDAPLVTECLCFGLVWFSRPPPVARHDHRV